MSPELLRCPPVPGARRIPAAGPARCSRGDQEVSALAAGPRRGSRAPLPSSPQWSEPGSALRHERGREGSQTTGAPRAGRGGECGSSRPRPPLQAPPSSRPLGLARGRPQGTSGGFRSLGCGTAPRPRESVKQALLHLFISHIRR